MTAPGLTRPRPEVVAPREGHKRQAWIERTTDADHKSVALLYIATALTFLAAAALEFALMRMQLIVPENTLIEPEIFNRLLSAAPASFVVLGLMPLALGVIGYIVPLQIGTRAVALPRLNQFSYWLYLAGAITLYASPTRRPRPGPRRCRRSRTRFSPPATAPTPGSPAPAWRSSGSSALRST
jgi:hypothetical protein